MAHITAVACITMQCLMRLMRHTMVSNPPQVLETDGRTNATAALGRVVIDLSQFTSIDGQELRTFQVCGGCRALVTAGTCIGDCRPMHWCWLAKCMGGR